MIMNHEESNLQRQCVAWFRAQYPQYAMLLTHPINEGSGHTTTDRRRQGIHKAEGAVAGVPDLILFMPYGKAGDRELDKILLDVQGYYYAPDVLINGLGIEFKTLKGRQSQEQKEFEKIFEAACYAYVVVREFVQFKSLIEGWIAGCPYLILDRIKTAHAEIVKAAEQREKEKFYKVIGKK